MNKILELRDKRNTLWEQTKNYLEVHRDGNGLVPASALEQYDKMTADVKALGEEIKRLEDQMEMDAMLSAPTSAPVQMSPVASRKPDVKPTATEEYSRHFWDAMRGRFTNETATGLSVGTDEKGGYTVPAEFERRLIQALEENNIFRTLAHTIRTSSGTRTIPIASEYGEAAWIEEGTAIPESDMTFTVQTLNAFKMGSMVRVSNELLHDSAFDIASYIAQRLGRRFGNCEENAFINGLGVSNDPTDHASQPTGILTSITTPAATTENASTITFDDVYRLFYGLKGPYRQKAKFLCNETVLLQLMLLKDGNGRYLWKPGLEIGKPDTILGHEIYTSTYMPAITNVGSADAGKKVLLFGDFEYYWVADRTNRSMKRLDELYAVTDQVGFLGTQRVDGKLILPEAMQVLALGANG